MFRKVTLIAVGLIGCLPLASFSQTVVKRINAGGGQETVGGFVYEADIGYANGNHGTYSIGATAGLEEIHLTEGGANADLATFSYDIPIADGHYEEYKKFNRYVSSWRVSSH